jgi:hypothetical protein
LSITYSCTESFTEETETEQSTQVSVDELTVKSLEEIKNPVFATQLKKSEAHLKSIISKKFNHLLIEHNLDELLLDTDYIKIENTEKRTSYSLYLVIPQKYGQEDLNLYGYTTFNFESDINTSNELQIGYQMEYTTNFDKNGKIVAAKYYSPKPSNIASKAPKYIVCRYVYCGYGGWSGSYGPAPQSTLDMYAVINLPPFNVDDISMVTRYWYDPQTLSTQSYANYFTPTGGLGYTGPLYVIQNEIDAYYYAIDLNTSIVPNYLNPNGNADRQHHLHKESFINSFQRWLFRLYDTYPNTYQYIFTNQSVLEDVFKLFTELNLESDMDEGVYLEVPYGIYSNNSNVRCISYIGNYLISTNGTNLLQQLGDSSITYNQFKSTLLSINCN